MTRSFSDWADHAARASDDAEADRCLDEAIALATGAWHWAKLIDVVVEWKPPRRVREISDRALATAIGDPDVWCFRKTARARAVQLDDKAGAREVLELAVLAFVEYRYRPSWALLAQGFAELGEPDGARRCLDLGCERARKDGEVDDLARLAAAYAEHGDPATAIARADEAEAMLMTSDGRGAWALANTWEQLGRVDDARRVLEAGADIVKGTRDALHVARAWVHHGGGVGQPRAFARAEELAAGADDWIAIAGAAQDLAMPDRARAALTRALAAAGDDADLRGTIAAAYVKLLGDHAAADAIGARGLRPDDLEAGPLPALAGWAPSPSGLFDWLRARVPRAALEGIARADYGMDYDRHLAALADICATGLVPRKLEWHPREVVELTRWRDGEKVDHLARALAVTLLCLCDQADLDNNGAPLVESVLELGAEPTALAAGLLAWCDGRTRATWARMKLDDEHTRWVLITLAVLAAAVDPDDARIADVTALIAAHAYCPHLPRELARSQRQDMWRHLLDRHVRPHAARVPALAALLACLDAPTA